MDRFTYPIGKPWVAVKVMRKGKRNTFEVLQETPVSIPANTRVFRVPDEWKIVDDHGESLCPTGYFVMTAETIDPYHLLADVFNVSAE
ncbi:MAG: hypothetical protein LIP12_10075 [Clostridiales bacterium]|nr:hypothetical protein [Clostridiales bacterium]